MNDEILTLVSMIKGIIVGNSLLVSQFLRYIIPGIISNLQSLIAAPHLKCIFIELAFCAFYADETKKNKIISKVNNGRIKLSDSVINALAYCTLRKLKPKCVIDDAWLKEDLGKFIMILNVDICINLYM